MDPKSMAKSKRSHTQHHQPKKPHTPKKENPSSSSTNKDIKQKKSKTTQPSPPSLPSNWDRYETEDEEDEVEIPINSDSNNTTQFTEVKPKSKGADFRDLIAQGNADSRSWVSPPSFDDKLPESYQGVAPMLAARGQKIFLQDRDDDFLMEDEASGVPEAQFLTLDLEDLAERLSKIEVTKRLFIEPDLLPLELHGQHANDADSQASFQTPVKRKIGRVDSFCELLSLYLEEEHMAKEQDDVDKNDMIFSSNISSCEESKTDADVTNSNFSDLGFFDTSKTGQDNNGGRKDTYRKSEDAGQVVGATKQVTESKLEDLEFLKETEMTQTNATELDTTLSSRFEAAAAEAELDVLLGSFSETKLFDTSVNEPGTSETRGTPSQNSRTQPPPAFPVTTSLDDELDDLLAVTANPNVKDELSLSQPLHILSSSSSQTSSKSKVLEDFDSWLDTI